MQDSDRRRRGAALMVATVSVAHVELCKGKFTVMNRDQLISLICDLRDRKELGDPIESIISAIQNTYGATDVLNLCDSDFSEETIADIVIGTSDYERKMTNHELLEVIRRFSEGATSEAEVALLLSAFEFNCLHPAKADLLIRRKVVFGKDNPSYEEILNATLGIDN